MNFVYSPDNLFNLSSRLTDQCQTDFQAFFRFTTTPC
jgi:hypothetical protein